MGSRVHYKYEPLRFELSQSQSGRQERACLKSKQIRFRVLDLLVFGLVSCQEGFLLSTTEQHWFVCSFCARMLTSSKPEQQ